MSEKAHNICYQTIHLPTGIQYLGYHSTNDLDDGYIGSGPKFRAFRRGRPRSEFAFHILRDYPTREQARKWEEFAVTRQVVEDPRFMNNQLGGGGGRPLSSDALARRNAGIKAAHNRPEAKAKRSAMMKERMAGSAERDAAIARLAHRRKSEEEKRKIGDALRGGTHTEKSRRNMSEAHNRPVIVGDRWYPSGKAAAEGEGVSPQAISGWLRTGRNGTRRPDGVSNVVRLR